jgi:hypothetical protein
MHIIESNWLGVRQTPAAGTPKTTEVHAEVLVRNDSNPRDA